MATKAAEAPKYTHGIAGPPRLVSMSAKELQAYTEEKWRRALGDEIKNVGLDQGKIANGPGHKRVVWCAPCTETAWKIWGARDGLCYQNLEQWENAK